MAYFTLSKYQLNKSNDNKYITSSELGIKHLVLAEEPKLLATQLILPDLFSLMNASKPNMKRERASAIMRAILQFLAVENLRDANVRKRC